MGETCWLCGDLLVCWCGKIGIEGGCFIVGTCVAPWSVMVGLGQVVCGDGIYHARPPARHWLRQWQRYRRCYEW